MKKSETLKKFEKNIKNLNNESIILNTYYNNNKKNIVTANNNKKKFTAFYKKIDYSYVKAKVETGLSEIFLQKLLNNNNNKKLQKKQIINKNNEQEKEKKQSIIKRCKNTMNKTIVNIKEFAMNIKKKIFKNGNKDKNNNNNNDDKKINTLKNTKKI